MAPQTSPDHGLFVVVSGGGWVQVGGERDAISHGEAVEWPPGVVHGVWTDGSPMRAILIEVPAGIIEASPGRRPDEAGRDGAHVASSGLDARGSLATRDIRPEDHDVSEGEPW